MGISWLVKLRLRIWSWFTYRRHALPFWSEEVQNEAFVPRRLTNGLGLVAPGLIAVVIGGLLSIIGQENDIAWLTVLGFPVIMTPILISLIYAFSLIFDFAGEDRAKQIQAMWDEKKAKKRMMLEQLSTKINSEGGNISQLGLYRHYWRICYLLQSDPEDDKKSIIPFLQNDLQVIAEHTKVDSQLSRMTGKLLPKIRRIFKQAGISMQPQNIISSVRISRTTFWIRIVVIIAINILILSLAINFMKVFYGTEAILFFWTIISYYLYLMTCILRAHDRNKSGEWAWLYAIPYIGWLWALIELGFFRGTKGPNDFGADPLES